MLILESVPARREVGSGWDIQEVVGTVELGSKSRQPGRLALEPGKPGHNAAALQLAAQTEGAGKLRPCPVPLPSLSWICCFHSSRSHLITSVHPVVVGLCFFSESDSDSPASRFFESSHYRLKLPTTHSWALSSAFPEKPPISKGGVQSALRYLV